MYISLTESRATGFRRWSETHQPYSNDDDDGALRVEANAIAAADSRYAAIRPARGPRAPWLVPGVGNTF
jgi:hypothetical protein